MSFNIGSQSGGIVNNVAGSQYNTGGQQGNAVGIRTVRQAVEQLRTAAQDAAPDGSTAASVTEHLDAIDAELAQEEPDRPKVGRALDKVAALLLSAGAVAGAGQALVAPVQTIASWVGSWGPQVAQLLAHFG